MSVSKSLWCLAILVACQVIFASGNPCCSYPCQNRAVCLTTGPRSYRCECASSEFYGEHCQHATLFKRLKVWLTPEQENIHYVLADSSFKWLWDIVNSVSFLSRTILKTMYLVRAGKVSVPSQYTAGHTYPTLEAAFNMSYYAMVLPPVPTECPTPMGTKGPKKLPDVEVLAEKVFRRTKFRPDRIGTNVLFAYFAQHFTHMFFKTDYQRGPGFQWGRHGVDMSNVYGKDKEAENRLRSFQGGRLRMRVKDGEEYPLTVAETGAEMDYPDHVSHEHRYALGHSFFGLLPGLMVLSTVYMREHNRVCGVLAQAHPEWDDERLYQTAKLVLLGETVKIAVEDYVQHLSNYNIQLKFLPEQLFGENFQYHGRIYVEFNHIYHWHALVPDTFPIDGEEYSTQDLLYHSELVFKHGLGSFVKAMVSQRAGMVSHHNHGPVTMYVLKDVLEHQRQVRIQSLNNYREFFGLKPYTSFQELTGEKVLAAELQALYEDIDAVEFYVGAMVEKHRHNAMFGSTVIEIGGPFYVIGLMSSIVSSETYWRASTFGGDVGFDIIKGASLQKLVCQNVKGECPTISFRIPDYDENERLEDWDGSLGREEL